MATATTTRVDWKLIWAQPGFRYFFLAMFVSLFGSGMNFVGVSWYIMAATHSTVKVSLQVIVVTLPGLFIPFLGGVLIDRFDRRYLGVCLDIARGFFVLATAYIAWRGNLQPKAAAKENLASFQQRPPFRHFLPNSHRAFQFVSHEAPLSIPRCK